MYAAIEQWYMSIINNQFLNLRENKINGKRYKKKSYSTKIFDINHEVE